MKSRFIGIVIPAFFCGFVFAQNSTGSNAPATPAQGITPAPDASAEVRNSLLVALVKRSGTGHFLAPPRDVRNEMSVVTKEIVNGTLLADVTVHSRITGCRGTFPSEFTQGVGGTYRLVVPRPGCGDLVDGDDPSGQEALGR
jgi:hypothetical protein